MKQKTKTVIKTKLLETWSFPYNFHLSIWERVKLKINHNMLQNDLIHFCYITLLNGTEHTAILRRNRCPNGLGEGLSPNISQLYPLPIHPKEYVVRKRKGVISTNIIGYQIN